ncbi:hypothetical protein FCM35_KLT11658 [Carex littledalei]|uniref:Uncharacterized protein n=1 Tax=Carex littledalei TaxID=544730 RepID=A0A833V3N4_9POAL|nr:hypothetical protein FCM35_KLT11658 [Carex littledalei]
MSESLTLQCLMLDSKTKKKVKETTALWHPNNLDEIPLQTLAPEEEEPVLQLTHLEDRGAWSRLKFR